MSTANDGGPAFPQPNHIVDHEGLGRVEARQWLQDSGMTLRDWFAGQALKSMMEQRVQGRMSDVARTAFQIADAMLAERERKR